MIDRLCYANCSSMWIQNKTFEFVRHPPILPPSSGLDWVVRIDPMSTFSANIKETIWIKSNQMIWWYLGIFLVSTAQMINKYRIALRYHYCSIPAQGPTWYLTWYAFDQLTNTLIDKFHKWLFNSAGSVLRKLCEYWHTALWCLAILFAPKIFVQIAWIM